MVMLSGYVDPAIEGKFISTQQLRLWLQDVRVIAEYSPALQHNYVAHGVFPDSGFGGIELTQGALISASSTAITIIHPGREGDVLMMLGRNPKWVNKTVVDITNNIHFMVG